MFDRVPGLEHRTPRWRARRQVIRLLLRRLEELLGERQSIICKLEMFAEGGRLETSLLRRRLLKVTGEQVRLLDELDALVGVGDEHVARRDLIPVPNRTTVMASGEGCADTLEEALSALSPAPPRREESAQ